MSTYSTGWKSVWCRASPLYVSANLRSNSVPEQGRRSPAQDRTCGRSVLQLLGVWSLVLSSLGPWGLARCLLALCSGHARTVSWLAGLGAAELPPASAGV